MLTYLLNNQIKNAKSAHNLKIPKSIDYSPTIKSEVKVSVETFIFSASHSHTHTLSLNMWNQMLKQKINKFNSDTREDNSSNH